MGLQRVGHDLDPTLRSHKIHAFQAYVAWFLGLSQSWVNITAAYPKKPNVWDLTPSGPFSSWQPQICVWDSLRPHGLEPIRLLIPWNFPGRTTGVGYHALLQRSFPTQGWNPVSCIGRWTLPLSHLGSHYFLIMCLPARDISHKWNRATEGLSWPASVVKDHRCCCLPPFVT